MRQNRLFVRFIRGKGQSDHSAMYRQAGTPYLRPTPFTLTLWNTLTGDEFVITLCAARKVGRCFRPPKSATLSVSKADTGCGGWIDLQALDGKGTAELSFAVIVDCLGRSEG